MFKIWLIRTLPWQILRLLWVCSVVRRGTVFRWEMNAALGEWA